MRRRTTITLLVVGFLLFSGTLTVTASEPPLADAGLDQDVSRGTTVLLDGTGSRDPDDSIESYQWSIETPNETVIEPECSDCARTQFTPTEVGQYNATLEVSAGGQTSTDTLFIVVKPGAGPHVTVSGNRNPVAGNTVAYTASIESGVADLDRVEWYLDGQQFGTESLAGEQGRSSVSRTYPNPTGRTLKAVAYDEDGQRGSTTVSVSVQEPVERESIASQTSPEVRGDTLVTGSRPLDERYTIDADTARSNVDTVEWYGRTVTRGAGFSETITWSPGTHELYAVVTYVDGSNDVARFSDGSTTVIADPKPALAVENLTQRGSIRGTAIATDGYENLERLTVTVNGSTVQTAEADSYQQRLSEGDEMLERTFEYESVEPGQEYEVTITATDTRGQTTTLTKSITPVGNPEIVRSEFVNGPVDSHHPRINESRYAAHHVLEIDLNGVDPNDLSILQQAKSPHVHRINKSTCKQDGNLIVSSYWYGESPKSYKVRSDINYNNWQEITLSILRVTPSDPELRYSVVKDGTIHNKRGWGMVVDASDSFDPDGTKLEYIWTAGAQSVRTDDSRAKFNSREFANLVIRDGYGRITKNSFNFLGLYNPGIKKVELLTDGPYKPNETVRAVVFSNDYSLTKNTYQIDLNIAVQNGEGAVTSWRKIRWDNHECMSTSCKHPGTFGQRTNTGDVHRYSYYVGVVEFQASELKDSSPRLAVYNEQHPTRTKEETTLRGVEVLEKAGTVKTNISVENLRYLVERPIVNIVTTQNESDRDAFIDDGYSVEQTSTTSKFTLEKYTKVEDAEYRMKTKQFTDPVSRAIFLLAHPTWERAESYSKTKRWTTTETEWRDEKSGRGTFTGDTRRVQTEPPEHRVMKKYEYEYTVQKTRTRYEERTKWMPVTKTGTRYVWKCNHYIDCYWATETYTYRTYEQKTFRQPVTETYEVTKTDTYWARSKMDWSHDYTGELRRTLVEPAEYTTQYEYKYEVQHSKTTSYYPVKNHVQVEEPKYEWKVYDTVNHRSNAELATRYSDDRRVGDEILTTEWELRKQTGNRTLVTSSYENPNNVIETRATVTGDIDMAYQIGQTTELVHERDFKRKVSYDGVVNSNRIINKERRKNEN